MLKCLMCICFFCISKSNLFPYGLFKTYKTYLCTCLITSVPSGRVKLCLIFFCIVPTTLRTTRHCSYVETSRYTSSIISTHSLHLAAFFSGMNRLPFFPWRKEIYIFSRSNTQRQKLLLSSVENINEGFVVVIVVIAAAVAFWCVYMFLFWRVSLPHGGGWEWGQCWSGISDRKVLPSVLEGLRTGKDFPRLRNRETSRLADSVLLVTTEESVFPGGRPVKFPRAQVPFWGTATFIHSYIHSHH